jgi:DNA-binding beta-propeller fold protein YncE
MTKRSPRGIGVWLVGLSLGVGCSANPRSGSSAGKRTTENPSGDQEFHEVLSELGVLDTLAGAGQREDDANEWRAAFEGGRAVDAELSGPHSALGDDAGNTYIADKDAHAIRVVRGDGTLVTVAGMNAAGDDGNQPGPGRERHLNQPNGIWVKGNGTVFILDLGNEKIRRLAPDGTLTTLFGVPHLAEGRGLWVSDDETLVYVSSGTELKRWRAESGLDTYADGFTELGNLWVDADDSGTVYVTDRGAHRVYRVAADRQPEPIAGDGSTHPTLAESPALEASLNGVRGIWRHPLGGLLLATHEGSQVLYLDTQGFIHLLVDGKKDAHAGDGKPISTSGLKVSEVRSVAMNPQGDLLITEHDAGYVRIARHEK